MIRLLKRWLRNRRLRRAGWFRLGGVWYRPRPRQADEEAGWDKIVDEDIAEEYVDELDRLGVDAARRAMGFDEDHSLGARSWGKGRHTSIPHSHGAEGRNWTD